MGVQTFIGTPMLVTRDHREVNIDDLPDARDESQRRENLPTVIQLRMLLWLLEHASDETVEWLCQFISKYRSVDFLDYVDNARLADELIEFFRMEK